MSTGREGSRISEFRAKCLQLIRTNIGEEQEHAEICYRARAPGAGKLTCNQVLPISQKSRSVLSGLGPKIQWLHSYVKADKIYCVYVARHDDLIMNTPNRGGFRANSVSEVKLLIDRHRRRSEKFRAGMAAGLGLRTKPEHQVVVTEGFSISSFSGFHCDMSKEQFR